MKCYIIGLKRLEEELNATCSLLEGHGFKPVKYWGFDGHITGLEETKHKYDKDEGGARSIGALSIGNVISQVSLWKALQALEPDAEHYLVMEDDVRFNVDNPIERIEQAFSVLPDDWDLFYVGCSGGFWCIQEKYDFDVCKIATAFTTHCFFIRRKALDFLIEKCEKVWAPIDLQIIFECAEHLNLYAFVPRIADQLDTELGK